MGDEEVRFDPFISGELNAHVKPQPPWSIGWVNPGETRLYNCLLLPQYSTRFSVYKEMSKNFPNMRGMPDGISFTSSFNLT